MSERQPVSNHPWSQDFGHPDVQAALQQAQQLRDDAKPHLLAGFDITAADLRIHPAEIPPLPTPTELSVTDSDNTHEVQGSPNAHIISLLQQTASLAEVPLSDIAFAKGDVALTTTTPEAFSQTAQTVEQSSLLYGFLQLAARLPHREDSAKLTQQGLEELNWTPDVEGYTCKLPDGTVLASYSITQDEFGMRIVSAQSTQTSPNTTQAILPEQPESEQISLPAPELVLAQEEPTEEDLTDITSVQPDTTIPERRAVLQKRSVRDRLLLPLDKLVRGPQTRNRLYEEIGRKYGAADVVSVPRQNALVLNFMRKSGEKDSNPTRRSELQPSQQQVLDTAIEEAQKQAAFVRPPFEIDRFVTIFGTDASGNMTNLTVSIIEKKPKRSPERRKPPQRRLVTPTYQMPQAA